MKRYHVMCLLIAVMLLAPVSLLDNAVTNYVKNTIIVHTNAIGWWVTIPWLTVIRSEA